MNDNQIADALRFVAILAMGPFSVVATIFITVWLFATRSGDMKPDPTICSTDEDSKEWKELQGIKDGMTYEELLAIYKR